MTCPVYRPFDTEAAYRRYMCGLMEGDRLRCRAVFEEWLASSNELGEIYHNLVRRSLYEIGDLWQNGRISVAEEHLATAITESLLNLTYARLSVQPRVGKSAIVACAANERHQIGGRIVADIFQLHGWHSYFLGANTSLADLHLLVEEKRPDVIALSVTLASTLDSLLAATATTMAAFPNVPILVGGQALDRGGRQRLCAAGLQCVATLGELEAWIKEAGRDA
jgi:methanogenic corrinoid protein MtbC1